MKNTYVSELTDGRETVSFPLDSTLKDLLLSLMENWRINNFYIVDEQGRLQGVLKKSTILEFLTPVYCTIGTAFDPALDDRMGDVKVSNLIQIRFPYLTSGLTVTEALALFIEYDQNYLPLLDRKGRLLGEVSSDSLIKLLPIGNRERLYAV